MLYTAKSKKVTISADTFGAELHSIKAGKTEYPELHIKNHGFPNKSDSVFCQKKTNLQQRWQPVSADNITGRIE